jgi:hypothetical protein
MPVNAGDAGFNPGVMATALVNPADEPGLLEIKVCAFDAESAGRVDT